MSPDKFLHLTVDPCTTRALGAWTAAQLKLPRERDSATTRLSLRAHGDWFQDLADAKLHRCLSPFYKTEWIPANHPPSTCGDSQPQMENSTGIFTFKNPCGRPTQFEPVLFKGQLCMLSTAWWPWSDELFEQEALLFL